ncbi:MAG: 3-phosphoshikimate 1-carboxyvinyltransferase [Alistipes sp.]|nr:3-phosphoshikimate 1-carboxyvinyltransferase [Alistipes sp.]
MDKSVSAGSVKGIIAPPSSKSYAQRAIALALLAQGKSILRNIEFCKDTRSALSCIEALGAKVEVLDHNTIAIEGGLCPQTNTLQVGESGLATRLFTPIASLWHEAVTIQGEGTLLHRPMIMMIEPLRALGVEVRDGGGYLPIEVKGPIHGGEIKVDGSISSQFITGLLLSLPLAEDDTTLHVTSPVSTPYIDMTIDTARLYGIEIMQKEGDYTEFFIEGGQKYTPADISIEGDWSGASSMLVAGAIAGEVTVKNISTLSKQADTAIIRALERAGAGIIIEQDSITVSKRPLKAFSFDATNAPDLFPALAALAAAAEGVSTIIGTSRLRHKESDRAETLRQEYEKLGIEIDISEENVMKIRGGKIKPAAVFSHGDHRIAMSLAVSALRCEGEVIIEQAESVEKSYPTFFEDLESIIQR